MKKFVIDVKARFCVMADDIEEAMEIVRDDLTVGQSVDASYDSNQVDKFEYEV